MEAVGRWRQPTAFLRHCSIWLFQILLFKMESATIKKSLLFSKTESTSKTESNIIFCMIAWKCVHCVAFALLLLHLHPPDAIGNYIHGNQLDRREEKTGGNLEEGERHLSVDDLEILWRNRCPEEESDDPFLLHEDHRSQHRSIAPVVLAARLHYCFCDVANRIRRGSKPQSVFSLFTNNE